MNSESFYSLFPVILIYVLRYTWNMYTVYGLSAWE